MTKLLTVLLLIFSLLYLPQPCFATELDDLLSTLLVGSWEEGSTPYGVVTFTPDGHYQAKMFETNQQQVLLLKLAGTWEIKNSELHSLLSESNSSKAPVGETFVDKIVQINQSELVLIGVNGEQYSKFRVTVTDK